jgi:hypothetical protein
MKRRRRRKGKYQSRKHAASETGTTHTWQDLHWWKERSRTRWVSGEAERYGGDVAAYMTVLSTWSKGFMSLGFYSFSPSDQAHLGIKRVSMKLELDYDRHDN